MRKSKVYRCKISGYRIEYIINYNDHIAETVFIMCDYQNMKAFLSLLRLSIDKLKEEQVTHIIQNITQDEWETYLKGKTSWNIIETDNKYNIHTIKCSIDDYLENYGVGIGL